MEFVRNEKILRQRLIPAPRELTLNGNGFLPLRDGVNFLLRCTAPEAGKTAAAAFARRFWNIEAAIQSAPPSDEVQLPPAEGYHLEITPEKLILIAADIAGVHHAFQTLRQLAEPERGVERFRFYFLPSLVIDDHPEFRFRGLHLCIFPETELWQLEKCIRMAAYYKFNFVILEPWGVFPFQSCPELCRPDRQLDPTELKNLIHLGRELGVTLCPQLNILGHASGSRVVSGKHAVLGYDPTLQSLFEPDGWTWCLSNPATRHVLTRAVLELYDFFEAPPFFHLGCDEAYRIGTCASCRNHDLHTLVLNHITHFHSLLKERGCRTIIWHDMLLNREDPRWKHYIVCGHAENQLDQLYRDLPRDLIIADWQYDDPHPGGRAPEWPTSRFFQQAGYEVVVAPWHNFKGTISLTQHASRIGLKGVLMTTWHQNSGWNFQSIFFAGAQGAWNPLDAAGVETVWDGGSYGSLIGFHVRQIDWDMKIHEYRKSGLTTLQIAEESFQV